MKRAWKALLTIYLAIVLLKVLLAYFVPSPTIFGDEYVYAKVARGFFENGMFMYHGDTFSKFPFLYPLILSISYIFQDMNLVYFSMKVINAILSSLVIFPLFGLAKEFLDWKQSLFIATLISFTAPFFNVSNYILSENLFFPLYIFTVYFMYMAFSKGKTEYFFLSGIFLGLTYLSRILGISLVPIVFLLFLIYRSSLKNLFVHYLAAFVVVLPLLIKHVSLYGFSILGLLGGYKGPTYVAGSVSVTGSFLPFVNWVVIYGGYALLAVGVFLGIYYLTGFFVKEKKFKILYSLVSLVFFINVLVVANQSNVTHYILYNSPFSSLFTTRSIGRYLDPAIALLFLVGYIVFQEYQKISKKHLLLATILSSIILLISTQLVIAPLLPINNQALTLYGAIFSGIEFVLYGQAFFGSMFHWVPLLIMGLLFVSLPWIAYALKNKRKLLMSLLIFFVVSTTILSFGITAWNSNGNWVENDQTELGKWFNAYDQGQSTLLFEEGNCENVAFPETLNEGFCTRRGSILGFWMNNDIIIGLPNQRMNYDYLVSQEEDLPYEILKREGNFIIYEANK